MILGHSIKFDKVIKLKERMFSGIGGSFNIAKTKVWMLVCAQQDFTDGGKKKTHDDCFKTKQNIAKTYWYTIFDYPLIEGFEGGQQSTTL